MKGLNAKAMAQGHVTTIRFGRMTAFRPRTRRRPAIIDGRKKPTGSRWCSLLPFCRLTKNFVLAPVRYVDSHQGLKQPAMVRQSKVQKLVGNDEILEGQGLFVEIDRQRDNPRHRTRSPLPRHLLNAHKARHHPKPDSPGIHSPLQAHCGRQATLHRPPHRVTISTINSTILVRASRSRPRSGR